MIRLSIYITLAILFALTAVWLVEQPGNLLMTWRGWEIRMSVAVLGLLVLIYTLTCWFLFKLYRWFRTDNPLTSPKRQQSRRIKGLQELDLAWSALAVSDHNAAIKHGKKAKSLLPGESGPLRLLIQASTPDNRDSYLHQLSENPHSRPTALKSQLEQKIHDHNFQAAYDILQEMHSLFPNNLWIRHRLFDMLTRLGKWQEARIELKALVKGKAIDAAENKKLTAALIFAEAVEEDLAGQKTAARDHAQEALKNDPAFIPAALLLSRHHIAHKDHNKARKVIENIWKIAPHPDLSDLFLSLEPLESASEKFRRVRKFCALNNDHVHSLHFLAKVGLITEHWADCKKALEKVIAHGQASQETYHLRARLEMLQKHDEQAAEDFIARAEQAPADPTWHCQQCGTSLNKYTATCPHCHDFGKIVWQE